jgi:hypothetical protein
MSAECSKCGADLAIEGASLVCPECELRDIFYALLEACREFIRYDEAGQWANRSYDDILDQARAAIALAEEKS